jgi:hypothetical protein
MGKTVELDEDVVANLHKQIGDLAVLLEQAHRAHLGNIETSIRSAIEHAIPLIKFAMTWMAPEATHGWPADDLRGFAEQLRLLPRHDLGQLADHQTWIDDVINFAREVKEMDRKRSRFQIVRSFESMPRGIEVIYMMHPVGGDPIGNAKKAKRWLKWLAKHNDKYTFIAPWIPFVEDISAEEDLIGRDRGLRDCLRSVRRSDAGCMVGGRMSSGMSQEHDMFRDMGRPVIDLLYMGELPPES